MANYTQDNRLLKITTPLGEDFLLMKGMTVTEGISQLFEMHVEVLHEEKEGYTIPDVVDYKKILGQPVSIEVAQIDQRGRKFNGIVTKFAQGGRGGGFSRYLMTVVPKIWTSTRNVQSRIFQQMTVPSILKEVFADHGSMIIWEFDYAYEPRNYCVQYGESDFDFASRLMEEEGIYYYFEHVDEKHTMIVSDKPRFSRNCPGNNKVTYTYEVTDGKFEGMIRDWDTEYNLQSGIISFRDHHIQQPNKKLATTSSTKFQIANNNEWEVYNFPGGYARKFDGIGPGGGANSADLGKIIPDGNRTAQTAMEVLDARFELSQATSDVSIITPGHRFILQSHPVAEVNGEYIITSVRHEMRQSPDYGETDQEGEPYKNEFTALAHGRAGTVPYRPPQVTPKPMVYGGQTAYVVGPPGEEIYTDDYGRVKVQFFWDRDGKTDGSDSCWVPVSQAWAGNGWGTMFIPRVGMEVIIHFLEGNPDNPIVAGCVYHPMNMPPYKLPEEKTKSTIKTDSSKGGGGFNELRFEDKKGSEQIFIHGEKDRDMRIKNDNREWVGNEEHVIVNKDRFEKRDLNSHLTISKDDFEKVGGDRHLEVTGKEAKKTGAQSLTVSGDQGISISGNKCEEATGTMTLKGMNVVIEGAVSVTLKAGSNFVNVGPAGVAIMGTMVLLNSGGAPGAPVPVSPVSPTAPKEPAVADDDQPGRKMKLETQSNERKKQKEGKEDPTKTSWIKIAMVDEEGKPVRGEAYKVKAPDGTFRSGTLDHNGKAEIKGIDPGSCEITFPNLDQDAWEDG